MVQDKTNTCEDVTQLGVQKMAIYRPQNHIKEIGSLKDIYVQIDVKSVLI